MSPELLKRGQYDFRVSMNQYFLIITLQTDVWSLGVTLYYVAYHRYPFIDDSIPALFKSIQTKELIIPKVATHSNKIGDFLRTLLDKNQHTRPYIHEIVQKWFSEKINNLRAKFPQSIDLLNYDKLQKIYGDLKILKKLKKS